MTSLISGSFAEFWFKYSASLKESKREERVSSLPLVLNENEYEDIVQSGAFFCRKCEWKESSNLLKLLDDHLNI